MSQSMKRSYTIQNDENKRPMRELSPRVFGTIKVNPYNGPSTLVSSPRHVTQKREALVDLSNLNKNMSKSFYNSP